MAHGVAKSRTRLSDFTFIFFLRKVNWLKESFRYKVILSQWLPRDTSLGPEGRVLRNWSQ